MLAALVTLFALSKAPAHRGACIGPFCIAPEVVRKSDLVRRYGKGSVQDGGTTLCYVDRGLYVSFELDDHDEHDFVVDAMRVATEPSDSCPSSRRPRRHFPPMRTREGIGVGSSANDAIRVYSRKPGYGIESFDNGTRVISWKECPDCGLLSVEITIRNGKVTAIDFNDSE